MKKLYFIGGTMGVGKTTTCQKLKKKLDNSVLLDGDWCWDSHPFIVNDETKRIVKENICFMLNNFINSSSYQNIIFCWVMHQQEIIDELLSSLNLKDVEVVSISLICDQDVLKMRLMKDVESGKRHESIIERTIQRLSLYHSLNTIKIDVSHKTVDEVVEKIIKL